MDIVLWLLAANITALWWTQDLRLRREDREKVGRALRTFLAIHDRYTREERQRGFTVNDT